MTNDHWTLIIGHWTFSVHAPGVTRTPGQRFRKPLLYPPELQRSEEHTSELQSLRHLVCRLLLEKKNNRLGRSALSHIGIMVRDLESATRDYVDLLGVGGSPV